jgi:hypothetical protein
MGQQQLLLLVLGVVIVGLAVVVGIQAFEENQRKARQDQVQALMVEIASKAQAWKMTHRALGGGDNGDADGFADFKLAHIGMTPTEVQGNNEVIRRTDYACMKIFAGPNRLRIVALNTSCGSSSEWARVEVRGIRPQDITYSRTRDGNHNGL